MTRVERLIAKGRIIWSSEGKPCKVRGCREPMKSSVAGSTGLYERGPQGGWICKAGHQGWIWPKECNRDTERQS